MVREKKFTKGPWVSVNSEYKNRRHHGVSPGKNLNVGVALTGIVGADDETESIANANLIASTPELLESLEFIKDQIIFAGSDGSVNIKLSPDAYLKFIELSEPAIAKAYGEQP